MKVTIVLFEKLVFAILANGLYDTHDFGSGNRVTYRRFYGSRVHVCIAPSFSRSSMLRTTIVGTGKTFLTSKVIDHVKKSTESSSYREGFAYFYFNQHEDERKEPDYAVRSWVRQLAATSRSPSKVRGFQTVDGKDYRDRDLSFNEWEICLLELVDSYSRTTLILDALDECDKTYGGQLLEVIDLLLCRSKSPLKLFISSRSNGDLQYSFQSHLGIVIYAGNNQEDIRLFIRKAITAHRRWGKMSVELQEHILQVITTRSNGM